MIKISSIKERILMKHQDRIKANYNLPLEHSLINDTTFSYYIQYITEILATDNSFRLQTSAGSVSAHKSFRLELGVYY